MFTSMVAIELEEKSTRTKYITSVDPICLISCSFQQTSCQIMGFCPKLRGCPPSWKSWIRPLYQCIANLLCIKSEHTTKVYRNCKLYIRMLNPTCCAVCQNQWWNQDFPEVGAPTLQGRQHTILPKFPKNCMKLKEFEPGGARPRAPLDPPLETPHEIK